MVCGVLWLSNGAKCNNHNRTGLRRLMMISFYDMPEMTEELAAVNRHIERLCHSNNASMRKVIDWILEARGKQIRPILTLLCAKLKDKKVDVTEMAAIIEICHTASLVHDDIIDNADERRGQLSVQKKFGREMAVYAGDFMIFVTLGRTELRLKPWYRDMFQKLEIMCDGELAQFDNQYNVNISEEQYIENILGKTSSMFGIACGAGAYEGGCKEKERALVGDFSDNFGLIFQMRDDLMDFVCSHDVTLKTVQNDFANGYYTLPAIRTFSHPEYGEELRTIAGRMKCGQHETEDDQRVVDLIRQADGFQYTRSKIQEYIRRAKDSLIPFQETKAKNKLIELVDYLWEKTPVV